MCLLNKGMLIMLRTSLKAPLYFELFIPGTASWNEVRSSITVKFSIFFCFLYFGQLNSCNIKMHLTVRIMHGTCMTSPFSCSHAFVLLRWTFKICTGQFKNESKPTFRTSNQSNFVKAGYLFGFFNYLYLIVYILSPLKHTTECVVMRWCPAKTKSSTTNVLQHLGPDVLTPVQTGFWHKKKN